MTTVVSAAMGACERPPTEPPGKNDPPPPGREYLNLEIFVKDRHAVEAKWYDYDSTNHTQVPKPQAWIVRDVDDEGAARFAAFRVKSIYDEADSGLFTLGVATFDGAAWTAESEWVSPRNEQDTGRLCLDLFSRDEVDCTAVGWQVRLEYFKYFAPQSLFFVDNPGVFVRSHGATDAWGDVRIALVDDVQDLSELPDPSSLTELEDGPAAAWDTSDWAFSELALDLPEAGMALGRRFVDDGFVFRDDGYLLLSFRLDMYLFTVRPAVDGDDTAGLVFEWETTDVSFEDGSYGVEFSEAQQGSIPSPGEGEIVFMRFNVDGLVSPASDLEGSTWPHQPPPSRAWDLGLVRDGGDLFLLVSPSAAVVNITALGLDEDA